MNPFLKAVQRSAGVRRWSRLFAAAGVGDAIDTGVGAPILFDMPLGACPAYGRITLGCQLIVDRTLDTEFKFDGLTASASGVYNIGTVASPFPGTRVHQITPMGAYADDPFRETPASALPDANRGVLVMPGGELSWIAETPAVTICKLGADAEIGASSITADQPVTFKAGDVLILSTTMYYQEGLTDSEMVTSPFPPSSNGRRRAGYGSELITVASDVTASTVIPISQSVSREGPTGAWTTQSTLRYRHHGRLQYLVAPQYEAIPGTNLSYTNTPIQSGDSFGAVNGVTITGAKVLASIAAGAASAVDNRATVGLITYPIKFGAPDDTDWQMQGYGAHLMVMGLSSKKQLQGVERYRVGQAGFKGRYPDHDHVRSYKFYSGTVTSPVSGTFLGDVDPTYNFTKQCSVLHSSNRGNTIHGTCGSVVQKNVYFDIDTHCIFLEDNSEERNVIDGNFICSVGPIRYGKTPIMLHDAFGNDANGANGYYNANGPSGIWYTNPNNYLRNNIVAGAQTGIWNAFSYPYWTSYNVTGTRVGNGTMYFWFVTHDLANPPNPPDEVITLTATSATSFARSGSVSGAMSAVTVGVQATHGTVHQYIVNAGTTAFVAGDTFSFTSKKFAGCFGLSRDVDITPGFYEDALEYLDNEMHSCVISNKRSQPMVYSETGDTTQGGHAGVGGRVDGESNSRMLFQGSRLWKGGFTWYQNEADHPRYLKWSLSAARENNGFVGGIPVAIQGNVKATAGGGQPAAFDACSFFVKTLDDYYSTHKPSCLVSYGGGINRPNCIFVPVAGTTVSVESPYSLPHVSQNGGTMRMWDFYVYPVNKHFVHDINTSVLGADPGYFGFRSPPESMIASNHPATSMTPAFSGIVGTIQNPWARGVAAALLLPPDGSMFGQAGGWWVFDSPFLLYGVSGAIAAQSPAGYAGLNGKLVPSSYSYIGVQTWRANGVNVNDPIPNEFPINYTRMQADGVTPVTGGTWNYGHSDLANNYSGKRHCAVLNTGIVKVGWARADVALPISLYATVHCMTDPAQHIVLGYDYDHTVGVSNVNISGRNFALTGANTRAALLAATDCRYWVDPADDVIWVHVWAGDLPQWGDVYETDRKFNRELGLSVNNG